MPPPAPPEDEEERPMPRDALLFELLAAALEPLFVEGAMWMSVEHGRQTDSGSSSALVRSDRR